MPSPFDKAKLACNLAWEDDWVTAVTFVGATRKLVAGNRLGGMLLWDLPETIDAAKPPLPTLKLDGHTNAVTHLAATPDGKLVLSASYDHTVAMWDVTAAPQGQVTVILDAENRLKNKQRGKKEPTLPDATLGVIKPAKVLSGHSEWIQAMTLSRDGKLLVTGDDAGEIIVWRLPDGAIERRWKTRGWISALAISPDSKTLAVAERIPLDGDRYRGLALWNLADGKQILDLMPAFAKKPFEFASADISPDGKVLALGQGDDETEASRVHFIDTAADKPTARETKGTHQYGVRCVKFTPDGKYVLSGGRDTTIKVWLAADGSAVKDIGAPRGGQFKDWICALAMTSDLKLVAGADMAGLVQVWAAGD